MVMTILAKVEVEKPSLQKSIWQFYVRMGLYMYLNRNCQNKIPHNMQEKTLGIILFCNMHVKTLNCCLQYAFLNTELGLIFILQYACLITGMLALFLFY